MVQKEKLRVDVYQGMHQLISDKKGPIEETNRFLWALKTRGLSSLTIRAYAYDLLVIYRWMNEEGYGLKDLPPIPEKYIWQEALEYCNSLNWGNKTDWRLPSEYEIISIVDYDRYAPAIDTDEFPNMPTDTSREFWSSSTFAKSSAAHYAWAVNFDNGTVTTLPKNYNGYVRCVRGEPSIPYETGTTYRVYYSFDESNPSQNSVDISEKTEADLGTVTVTNGEFNLYTQKADAVTGPEGYVGWAFIKLFAEE